MSNHLVTYKVTTRSQEVCHKWSMQHAHLMHSLLETCMNIQPPCPHSPLFPHHSPLQTIPPPPANPSRMHDPATLPEMHDPVSPSQQAVQDVTAPT